MEGGTQVPKQTDKTVTHLDIRDAALKGVADYLESEGLAGMTAMSAGFGIVYLDGTMRYIIEVHSNVQG
jgi:hypothetical protein